MCRRQETPLPIVPMLFVLPISNLNPQLEIGNIGTGDTPTLATLPVPAFARCCFRIAASLLVLTSPMASHPAPLRQCSCVNGDLLSSTIATA